MKVEMQAELPVELYNHFVEQTKARHCTVEEIVRETICKKIRITARRCDSGLAFCSNTW